MPAARDCGQYSAGGAGSLQAYRDWILAFATAVGNRPAIVVLGPYALPQLDCLDVAGKSARLELLRCAAAQFTALAPALTCISTSATVPGGPRQIGRLRSAQ